MALADLTVKIGADISELNKGLADAARGVKDLGGQTGNLTAPIQRMTGAANSAGTSFNALRGPLTGVTRQLLQLNPAVSQVSSVLGTLAIGAGPMVGILAGIAALSIAWNQLTKDARENAKATKAAIDELTQLREKQKLGSSAGTGARAAEQLGTERALLQDRISENQRLAAMKGPQFEALRQGAAIQIAKDLKEVDRLTDLIKAHEIALTEVRVKKAEERADAVAKANQKAFGKEKAQWDEFFADLRRKALNLQLAADKIGDTPPSFRPFGTTRIAPLDTNSVRTSAPNLTEIPNSLTRLQQATRAGFTEVSIAIGQTLAANLAGIFGGGRGAQIGGSILGGAGGAFAGRLLGANAGAFAGSIIPVIGTVAGSLLGSAIGSLFDHKKSVDKNTQAVDRLTGAILNGPSGFKVSPYEFAAARAQSIYTGPVTIQWSGNPYEMWRQLSRANDDNAARGGVVMVGG